MTARVGIVIALLAIILAGAYSMPLFLSPSGAEAAETTRTYTWEDGESQPSIAETIEVDGVTYTLKSTGSATQASANTTESQYFSRTVTSTCSTGDYGNIANIVANSVDVNENGYSGSIPRTGLTATPVNGTNTTRETITRTTTTTAQDDNLVSWTWTENGKTYTRDSVSYVPAMRDSQGNVLTWTATVTYGTDVSSTYIDHYDVVATYGGNLTKTVNSGSWSVTATYESQDEATNEEENTNNEEVVVEENTNEENANENTEDTSASTTNTNTNYSRDTNTNTSSTNTNVNADEANASDSGLPIIPIIIGLVALLALILIIALIARRKKNANADPNAAVAGVAAGGAVAGMAADETAVLPVEPQAQLIELVPSEDPETGEITAEQYPKANLNVEVSPDETIPTILYFPPIEDEEGNVHELAVEDPSAQLWIAIDEVAVEASVSDQLLVSTDDGYEVYRGILIPQFQLDRDKTIEVVNGTAEDLDTLDISDELDGYDEARLAFEPQYVDNAETEVLSADGYDYGTEAYDENYEQQELDNGYADEYADAYADAEYTEGNVFADENTEYYTDEYAAETEQLPVDEEFEYATQPQSNGFLDYDQENGFADVSEDAYGTEYDQQADALIDDFDDAATDQFGAVDKDQFDIDEFSGIDDGLNNQQPRQ